MTDFARYPPVIVDIFEILIESLRGEAIYMLDLKGNVKTWNIAAERCEGYKAEEILGRNYACFFTAEAIAQGIPRPNLAKARKTGHFLDETWHIRKDGTRFWAQNSLTSLSDAEGHSLGFANFTRDLTADRERRQLQLDKDRAEAADRAKSNFLASISHELRTPLNAIIGFAELAVLKAGVGLPPEIREYLGYVDESGHRLLKLIENVLDLAKVDEGRVSLSMENLDVRALLNDMERAARLLDAHGDRRILVQSVEEGSIIRADRARVGQILSNFMSNAVKYGRAGGRIEIGCGALPDGRLELFVADDGPGIAWEKQVHVFEPFQRLGYEATAVEGTGVGLAISKRLVEAMGGEIGFVSEPGNGARFYARFERGDATEVRPLIVQFDARVIPDFPPVHILYIEDNPANLTLLRRTISGLTKAKLTTAPTGKIGLEIAHAERPDLIVTDVHLPDMDGVEILRDLRQHDDTRQIPVIALSADAQPRRIEDGLAAGFVTYLIKPIQIAALLSELFAALPAHTKVNSSMTIADPASDSAGSAAPDTA